MFIVIFSRLNIYHANNYNTSEFVFQLRKAGVKPVLIIRSIFIIYYFFQIIPINIMRRENIKNLGEKNGKKI